VLSSIISLSVLSVIELFKRNKMEIFLNLAPQILLLYFVIVLGFIASKHLSLNKDGIAKLSIYILVPMVMFYGVMKTDISLTIVFLPLIVWSISTFSALIIFWLSRKLIPERTAANILALCAGTANSGYFGIPVAFMLFEPKLVGIYITTVLGMTLFQNSVGFYITAKGHHTAKESFLKVLKLPVIYAFLLAVILKYSGVDELPRLLVPFFENVKGCYIIIGMMIIGAGIADMEKIRFNLKFISFAFLGRFLVWPLLAFLFYRLDGLTFNLLNENYAKALVLAAIVPIAADTVAIATILKTHPEDMAGAVLLSCLFALFYVPFVASILLVN